VKNSDALGNAVEREHKRSRIMPSGHCSTNIEILLLNTLLKNRRSSFESLRTNEDKVEMIDNVSFMLSLSQNSELFSEPANPLRRHPQWMH
jgi:hypothetical protein